jgi:DNA-directed RNA polymerase II subunit RPB1
MMKYIKHPEMESPTDSLSDSVRELEIVVKDDSFTKRRLLKREIKDITSKIPSNHLVIGRLTDQLKTVWIYPDLIPKLKESIVSKYYRSLVPGGENVGILAATSIGEPATQSTLNTFHYSGVGNRTVTTGIPRFSEIINLKNAKSPYCRIPLKPSERTSLDKVQSHYKDLIHLRLRDIVKSYTVLSPRTKIEVWYGTFCDLNMKKKQKYINRWFLRLECDVNKLHEFRLMMSEVVNRVMSISSELDIVYSPQSKGILDIYVDQDVNDLANILTGNKERKLINDLELDPERSEHLLNMESFFGVVMHDLLMNITVCGIPGIQDVIPHEAVDGWSIETIGTSFLNVLNLDFVEFNRCVSSDIKQIRETLGIEAARTAILNELTESLSSGSSIDLRHIKLFADIMTTTGNVRPITRHGLDMDIVGPIARASFEETMKMFVSAATNNLSDPMEGVSSNVLMGQEFKCGTGGVGLLPIENETWI